MEEDKHSFGSKRREIEGVRGRVKSLKLSDETAIEEGEQPWALYTHDVRSYVQSFSPMFPEVMDLAKNFKERKARGERVLVIDVLGEADAGSIGADKTICLTLTKVPRPHKDSLEVVEGDVFSRSDVKRLMGHIEAEHTPIACVFCRPLGGLLMYNNEPFIFARLYDALRDLYERLASDGEMYLEIRYTPKVSEALKQLAALFDEDSLSARPGNGFFAIHITKTPEAPERLPKLSELRIGE